MGNHYRDLNVWKKAIELVKAIYKATQKFPKEEIYGLISQMRRAAVSIPSNIAEGQTRKGNKEFAQFLYVSKGSAAELETQIIIAHELNYVSSDTSKMIIEQIEVISRMLFRLTESIK